MSSKNEIKALKETISRLCDDLDKKDERMRTLEDVIEAKNEKIISLTSENEKLQRENAKLTKKLRDANKPFKSYQLKGPALENITYYAN
jgi:chromosome segregation ATPase